MLTVDFNRIPTATGDALLDVGCGSGRHTCGAYGLTEALAVGTDLVFDELCKARDKLLFHQQTGHHGGGEWRLLASDVVHLPFTDNRFDAVICCEVMEHIARHQKAASELVRVLKPNKTLVVSVPRYYPERICWALSAKYHHCSGGHLRIYRKRQLVDLFEQQGVVFKAFHYAHSLHTPYWWLHCILGDMAKPSKLLALYQRFLVWDIMHKPIVSNFMEYLLNPICGKSLVVYFTKPKIV